jgi:O-antigen/teichoic acid export membrane protein
MDRPIEATPLAAAAPPASSAMTRDILSAYAASAARIGSWVIVLGLVFRFVGWDAFAMLALIRGTIGLLNYVSLGVAPSLMHHVARSARETEAETTGASSRGAVIPYYAPDPPSSLQVLYVNARLLALLTGLVGVLVCVVYAREFEHIYRIAPRFRGEMYFVVFLIGVGTMLRLAGDAPGAALQLTGQIATDNMILASGDIVWMVLAALFVAMSRPVDALEPIAFLYASSGAGVLIARLILGNRAVGRPGNLIRPGLMKSLLTYGIVIVAAQLADYLYSPTDYILIDRLLTPFDLAAYAPAVQIDSGLLLLVTGLSAVLLPKAAIAHAGRSTHLLLRYYVRGTIASIGLLAAASAVVWILSPWLFRLWLGSTMPETRLILPLVLMNTVIGGSAAVGRSILLAIGKARAFTISALIAGAVNVVCSYVFVRYLHWGLRGIVLGTVVGVVGRCVMWMPWYVLRSVKGTLQIAN